MILWVNIEITSGFFATINSDVHIYSIYFCVLSFTYLVISSDLYIP